EEIALLLGFLGLVECIRKRNRAYALGLLFSSFLYFLVAYKIIMPLALRGAPTTFSAAFGEFEHNPWRWFYIHLTEPAKLFSLLPAHKILNYLHFLASFAFLPLLGKWSTLLLIAPFGIQLISTSWLMTALHSSFPTQYGIVPMIAVAYASIEGLQRLPRIENRNYRMIGCLFLFLCPVVHASLFGFHRPDQLISPVQWKSLSERDQRAEWIRQTADTIVPSESIVTTRQIKSHLATRSQIWEWVVHGRSFFPDSLEHADKIVVDVQYLLRNDKRGLLELIECLENRPFGVTLFENDLVIADRDQSTEVNRAVISAIKERLGYSAPVAAVMDAEGLLISSCDSLEGWSPQPAVYLDSINAYQGSACVSRDTATDGMDRNFWFDGPINPDSFDEQKHELSLFLRSGNWESTHIPSISLCLDGSLYQWLDPLSNIDCVQTASKHWKAVSLPFAGAQKKKKPTGTHTLEIKILNPRKAPLTAILVSVDRVVLESSETP
ncbi:MAG: hypothetical protein ABIH23_00050, partial [bacterium]